MSHTRSASYTRKARKGAFGRRDGALVFRTLLFALGFIYLGFHAMHGERGIYAWFREVRMQESLTKELAKTRAEREALELNVTHMRDGSLDLDLLDEQTRRMLGGAKQDEKVVFIRK